MELETVIAIVLTALISGGGGFMLAVNRASVRMALIERSISDNTAHWRDCQDSLTKTSELNGKRLQLVLRLLIDVARKSNIEIRTADVLELTSLIPE